MSPQAFLSAAIRLVIEEQVESILHERGLRPLTESASREAFRQAIAMQTLKAVAEAYNITPRDITKPGRRQPGSEARQVTMFILRRTHGFTREQTVNAVGRDDVTTYNHAERTVRARMETDPAFAQRVNELTNLPPMPVA